MDKELSAMAALPSKAGRTTAIARTSTVEPEEAGDAKEANATLGKPSHRHPKFHFLVSQDEEHVRLELIVDGSVVDLGERAHHQTLLLLARERRGDECQSIISSEAGWRDMVSLGAMLGIDTQHINTHLFRALRQLSPALRQLVIELDLVERRRGQVRFGDTAFEVVDWKGLAAVRA